MHGSSHRVRRFSNFRVVSKDLLEGDRESSFLRMGR